MSIAIVGMLDEREEALRVIRDRIERKGFKTCLIDISIGNRGTVPSLQADVSAREIGEAARESDSRVGPPAAVNGQVMTAIMSEGLRRKVLELHTSGELEGIIVIAGLTGTLISLDALKTLPFGLPKLLLSSAAALPAYAARLTEYFASKDITVMHTVVDTVGMNHLVETIAVNGANAICGMTEGRRSHSRIERDKRPSLAITEFGFCDRGAHYVREILGEAYEIVSIHANGLGEKGGIDLVRQGYFQAFIDLVPGTFSDYILGGNRASGSDRLNVAMDQRIPYIFCPGGFDMICCGPPERRDMGDALWTSRRLSERQLYLKDNLRVEARTSAEEMEQLGRAVAERLNRYQDKELVKVVIPLKGFSSISVEEGALCDPSADLAFLNALERDLDPRIGLTRVDADINDSEFARVVAAALSDASETVGHL